MSNFEREAEAGYFPEIPSDLREKLARTGLLEARKPRDQAERTSAQLSANTGQWSSDRS